MPRVMRQDPSYNVTRKRHNTGVHIEEIRCLEGSVSCRPLHRGKATGLGS